MGNHSNYVCEWTTKLIHWGKKSQYHWKAPVNENMNKKNKKRINGGEQPETIGKHGDFAC